jgi:hypothetical protein
MTPKEGVRSQKSGVRIAVLLLASAVVMAKEPCRAPGNLDSMNAFAAEYNRYGDELRAGTVDMKQWERVEKAWKAVR